MSILSKKELKRLHEVRQMLKDGINPYEKINTLTLGGGEFINTVDVKVLTPKQRLDKFNSTLDKNHKWSFNDGTCDVKPITIMCIACGNDVEHVTSVYGRIQTGSFTIVKDGIKLINDVLTEYRKVIGVPQYKTGVVCKQCLDTLYADKYVDANDVIHRSIELLDRPVNKMKETVRKNHRTMSHTVPEARVQYQTKDDDLASGKGVRKSVTEVMLDRLGNETDEEWKTTLTPPVPEEIDGPSYNYFRRGR